MAELPSGTVTFLFTDLEASTRLWEREPEAMRAALARHDRILRDAVETHHGQVVKGTGDGIHAVFATAETAVAAALDAQIEIGAQSWELGEPPRVRMGIHTGVAELRDGDYFGSPVNRAARLMSIAHAGQILVSLATEELVRDSLAREIAFLDLGEHALRDLERPERIFQVRHPALVADFAPLPTGARGVQFSALGPLEIRVGSEFVAIQSPQLRLLMAALLVSWNEVVSTDQLMDAMWSDRQRSPPLDAVSALHTLVHRLRTALAGAGERVPVIVTRPPGYLIETDASAFDVPRFEDTVARARRAAQGGDTGAAVSAYDEALALWRGPAFAEFAYEDFARVEAARLDEARLVAIEDRAELKLSLGRHAELVGELEGVVAAHPYRERLCAALMMSLYRAGRQADALRVYALLRSTLGEELGIEPSAALRELETAIVRQEVDLDWEPGSGACDAPMVSAPHRSRSSVPIALSEIFGREPAIADAADALSTARIVTLTGSPGVGKTRLAAEVTNVVRHEYERVVWCELAGISESDVARAIATALQVRPERGEEVLTSILDAMWSSELLMVLDNCEHVIDDVARIVETIEHACEGVRVLATSREPLGADGEVVLRIAPLDMPSAIQLFATRARSARDDFRLDDDNADPVARICGRLDGVPLAIELAAARVTTFPPADLAERLDDRFALLASGRRTAAPRHQSLRAAIDWSYDLLEPEDQRILQCLGAFRGGFSLAGAEAVAADEPSSSAPVWPQLDSLVRRSLVSVDARTIEARFRLLETVREYAFERLVDAGDADVVAARHGRYFATFVESAVEPLTTAAEAIWTARINRELDNIIIALDRAIQRGDLDVALRLVSQAGQPVFSWATAFNQAIDRSALSALDLEGAAEHARFPGAASGVAWLACDRADFGAAARWADEAFAAEARLGTTPPLFYPWIVRANIAMSNGVLPEAVEYWARAVALMRDLDAPGLVGPLSFLASLRGGAGDRAGAAAEAEEAVRIARARGAPGALAIALGALAINIGRSDPARAVSLIRESVAAQKSVGHGGSGRALAMAVTVAAHYGSRGEAFAVIGEALVEAQRPNLWGLVLSHLATLIAADEPDVAAVLIGAADADYTKLARPWVDETGTDAVLIAALGEEGDAALRARGASLTRADAAELAQAAVARARARETASAAGP